jgi:hypothetical protein
MKRSEELRREASMAESDQQCLGLHTKAMREARKEGFEEKWLPLLRKKVTVTHHELMGKYTFSNKRLGTLDYYPKGNRVLIRDENRWVMRGLQWLIKNFELK